MKLSYTATAFAVSIAILSCQKEKESTSESTSALKQDLMEKSEETSQKLGEGVEAGLDLAAQARQKVMAAANQTLKEIDGAVNEFNQKAATLTADAKAGSESALAKLREQRSVVAEQLEKAKSASAEAWQESIRPELESALEGLKSAYQDFKSTWPKN